MKISNFISPDDLFIRLKANSKKQVLQEMVKLAASRASHIDQREVFDLLIDRERLGCTGIGKGIAIPHTRCSLASNEVNPIAILATLDKAIDFEASDDEPVDIVFMLLAPDTGGGEHLTVLALASRLLSTEGIADNLRKATTVDEAWSAILNADNAVAAA